MWDATKYPCFLTHGYQRCLCQFMSQLQIMKNMEIVKNTKWHNQSRNFFVTIFILILKKSSQRNYFRHITQNPFTKNNWYNYSLSWNSHCFNFLMLDSWTCKNFQFKNKKHWHFTNPYLGQLSHYCCIFNLLWHFILSWS